VAIFYYRANVISRSTGQSVCACAAYFAAIRIECQRTRLTYDYTKRTGVDHSEIIVPVMEDRQVITTRSQLWNLVEAGEKRPDAQLARSILLVLPTEIDNRSKIQLVREFVRENFTCRGTIADVNIHQLDSDRPHAYLLLTMRNLSLTATGEIQFGNKNRTWNSRSLIKQQKQNWATVANKYLAIVGAELIDHRNPDEQEIADLNPTIDT
jgi:ATP-dependent exoDNAse (exonuclease V) alpha subunit